MRGHLIVSGLLLLLVSDPAVADPPTPEPGAPVPSIGLGEVGLETQVPGSGDHAPALPPAQPGVSYRYTLTCKQHTGDICTVPATCAAPPGTYIVYLEQRIGNSPWQRLWQRCLFPAAAQEATNQPTLTPAMVNRAYQRLDWPTSTVHIQPGTTTLVNLPTILHTTNTTPTTRTITLLGTTITIQATPTRYTWHHGDHTTQTTTSPGHPYPTPGHTDVTHTYTRAADQLLLSVDTTYTGRYRIADGPWTPIPQPRTITGPTTPLTIRTATPHLIAPR